MKLLITIMIAACVALSGVAFALVPTEMSAAITALTTDAGTFIGSLWAIVVAVVIGFVFMKLFKKGVGRAT